MSYHQNGFVTHKSHELGISDQELNEMKHFMDEVCIKPGEANSYNSLNLEKQLEFSNFPQKINSNIVFEVDGIRIPSRIISQLVLYMTVLLGHNPKDIWVRFSKIIPKPHMNYGTTVHRDYIHNTPLEVLGVMVIDQENINATMTIMDSLNGQIMDPRNVHKYTTLWEAKSSKGQLYIINQKEFPQVHHCVQIKGDATSQRYVLTVGITKQHPTRRSRSKIKKLVGIALGCFYIGYFLYKICGG